MLIDKDGNKYCMNKCNEKPVEPKKEVVIEDNNETVICPKCKKGTITKRVARFGQNKGNTFYGCSNYPKCKNILTVEEYNNLIHKQ